MKLIIDIHEEQYDFIKQGMSIDKVVQFPALMEAICEHIANGTPLDDVKAEIYKAYEDITMYSCDEQVSCFASRVSEILNNIGKGDKE